MNRECFRYDILSELFNIGVGKAADMLSEIVNKKIRLQVPRIIMPDPEDGVPNQANPFAELFDAAMMVSTISFSDKLKGKANLVFPADKVKNLVALCSGEDSVLPEDTEFSDVDFDVIREIGNILLNCILGELGNLIQIHLTYDLPRVEVYHQADFQQPSDDKSNHTFLILFVTFLIDNTEIEGAVVIDLMVESIQELFHLLDEIEARL